VKTLGLTLVGYTWQWRCFCVVTLLKALLGLYLQLTFGGWIRRRQRLGIIPYIEALLLENLFCCLCDVKRRLVRMVVVVVRRSLQSFFFLFYFLLHLGRMSVLYDFALCRFFVCVCARVGVVYVHSSHAEASACSLCFYALDASF
jgi:hypothetical protein